MGLLIEIWGVEVHINSGTRLLSGNLGNDRYRDTQEPPKSYGGTFSKRNFNSQ